MAAPRGDDVRSIIMDTTEDLLESGSFDDLSLATIARTAGVSKGTLYYYYKTKEDILLDITDRFLAAQWGDFLAWTENKEKDTQLHRLVTYVLLRNAQETGPRIHLIYHACIGNEAIREQLIERYRRFQKLIAEKIAERAESVDPNYLAWLLLLTSDGIIVQKELQNPYLDLDKFLAETEQMVRKF